MNEIEKSKVDKLDQLHTEILGAMRTTLYKAIEAGGILQEVKQSLPHGAFTAWVEENVSFNLRTAQRYIKAHDNRAKLKNDTVSSLKELIEEPVKKKLGKKEREELIKKAREYIDLLPEKGKITWIDFANNEKGIQMVLIDRHIQDGYFILNAIFNDDFGFGYLEGTKKGLNIEGTLWFLHNYMTKTKKTYQVTRTEGEPKKYNDYLFINHDEYKKHVLGI